MGRGGGRGFDEEVVCIGGGFVVAIPLALPDEAGVRRGDHDEGRLALVVAHQDDRGGILQAGRKPSVSDARLMGQHNRS